MGYKLGNGTRKQIDLMFLRTCADGRKHTWKEALEGQIPPDRGADIETFRGSGRTP